MRFIGIRRALAWQSKHEPTTPQAELVASIQTSDGGSFYLGDGYCAFSGSLYDGIPADTLTLTGETREGRVWWFHHDYHTAHNGVPGVIGGKFTVSYN